MMIRINSMRFQNIVNNYIEILNDLEEDCCLYDTLKEDDKFYKQVSNSFRNNMKEMYTIFEDYLAFSLSSVGVAVTDNKLESTFYMMNNTEIIKVIHDIFTRDDIDACYIFGSFLTSRFTEQSDIDIAIVGNIELEDRLYIEKF